VTILLGIAGLVGITAGLPFLSWLASSWAARGVGARAFQLFDVERPCSNVWKETLIRGAGAIAPLVMVSGLFVMASLLGGESVPTTSVRVLAGPAREAGMQDGDRVLEIDDRAVDTWQELLAAVRAAPGTRKIVVDRGGARTTLSVTPNAAGRIGIESNLDHRPVNWANALETGIRRPFEVLHAIISVALEHKRVELEGPVGIVRATAAARPGGIGASLSILAIIGAYLWPAFAVMHLLDVATLPAFRRRYPARRGDDAPVVMPATRRMARRRQLLNALLIAWLPLLLASVIVEAGILGSAVLLPFLWLSPTFVPLTWLLARSLGGPVRAAFWVVALLVPCLNVVGSSSFRLARVPTWTKMDSPTPASSRRRLQVEVPGWVPLRCTSTS